MGEIEKLRVLLAEARGWVGGWAGILPKGGAEIDSLRQRIDAALAEPVSDDFRRGAEAMREAAAKEVCDYSVTVLDPFGRNVQVDTGGFGALGDIIRALPIPEDK